MIYRGTVNRSMKMTPKDYVCNCGNESKHRRSTPTCIYCHATMVLVEPELPDNVVSMVGRKKK